MLKSSSRIKFGRPTESSSEAMSGPGAPRWPGGRITRTWGLGRLAPLLSLAVPIPVSLLFCQFSRGW